MDATSVRQDCLHFLLCIPDSVLCAGHLSYHLSAKYTAMQGKEI
ncbi:mCG146102 [Mus musculus]|nr:mCG146102 [Mus musculus]